MMSLHTFALVAITTAATALTISSAQASAAPQPGSAAGSTSGAISGSATGSAAKAVARAAGAWAQSRSDPAHDGHNRFESILTQANAAQIAPDWAVSVSRPDWVLESSPSVQAGVAYLPTWDGHLFAVDATSGAVRWSRTVPGGMFGTAPVDSANVYTWLADDTMRAYDIATGKQRWKVSEPNGGGIPSVSLTRSGSLLYGATAAGDVFARRTSDGAQVWRTALAGPVFGSASVWKGEVLAVDDFDNVNALDALTGKVLWTTAVPGVNWDIPAGVSAEGLAFVIDRFGGKLVALNARTGTITWSVPLATSETLTTDGSSVAVSAGRVYVAADQDYVEAFSTAHGTRLWQRHVPGAEFAGGYYAAPTLANGVLWVTGDNSLLALTAKTGRTVADVATAGVFGEPVVSDGRILTAEADSALHAYALPH